MSAERPLLGLCQLALSAAGVCAVAASGECFVALAILSCMCLPSNRQVFVLLYGRSLLFWFESVLPLLLVSVHVGLTLPLGLVSMPYEPQETVLALLTVDDNAKAVALLQCVAVCRCFLLLHAAHCCTHSQLSAHSHRSMLHTQPAHSAPRTAGALPEFNVAHSASASILFCCCFKCGCCTVACRPRTWQLSVAAAHRCVTARQQILCGSHSLTRSSH
jgi:hypothetical protein